MRSAAWALCLVLVAAVAPIAGPPVARAQDSGLQLSVGGFHQGFLIGSERGFSRNERSLRQEFYSAAVGPVELSASVGGEPGEIAALGAAASETASADRLLSAGLQLGYGGFLGGLSYGFGDQGLRYEEQHRLSAGVHYSLDSFSFGPAFAVNWQEGTQSQARKVYVLEFGASYSLAPGIDATGALQHSRSEHGPNSSVNDKEGTAGLFGISISF